MPLEMGTVTSSPTSSWLWLPWSVDVRLMHGDDTLYVQLFDFTDASCCHHVTCSAAKNVEREREAPHKNTQVFTVELVRNEQRPSTIWRPAAIAS
jgi:hypothetical protein